MGDRKSIRMSQYDYSEPGYFFVTICTKGREELFGTVTDGRMVLNDVGKIIEKEWQMTPIVRSEVEIDEFVIMPNHLHGIIIINNLVGIGGNQSAPQDEDCGHWIDSHWIDSHQSLRKFGPQSDNLFAIIRGFKGASTRKVNDHLNNREGGSIWQSRFHDHIIRDEQSLFKIRNYINNNPVMWDQDENNPNK